MPKIKNWSRGKNAVSDFYHIQYVWNHDKKPLKVIVQADSYDNDKYRVFLYDSEKDKEIRTIVPFRRNINYKNVARSKATEWLENNPMVD